MRVLLCGDHPWAHMTGEVIDNDDIGMKVRLDGLGQEVYAFDGQWKQITDV